MPDGLMGQEITMSETTSTVLIAELEDAVRSGSAERRVQMLRRVTDLFLSDADRLNENQIGVFDEVLGCLIERMESRALAQLSTTLSRSGLAPKGVVRQLAYHEEVAVAGPMLAKSVRLSDSDLIEIANIRGQQHLLAISLRETLNEALTDVLLERGDAKVSHALAGNAGARFSETGYSTLVAKSETDTELAEKLGLRLDIPLKVLRDLLAKATAAVRNRLLEAAPPEMREKIQEIIQTITEEIGAGATPVDYTEADAMVLAMNRDGKLGNQTINRFAVQGEYTNVVAALALLSAVTPVAIEPLIGNPHPDGLIVACKAARLSWPTTTMILRNRPDCSPPSQQDIKNGKEVFDTLSLSAAQRTIRFWSARGSAERTHTADTAVARPDV